MDLLQWNGIANGAVPLTQKKAARKDVQIADEVLALVTARYPDVSSAKALAAWQTGKVDFTVQAGMLLTNLTDEQWSGLA